MRCLDLMMLSCFLLCPAVFATIVDAALSSDTRDREPSVAVGSTVEFNCLTNTTAAIRWYHRHNATQRWTLIHNGREFKSGVTQQRSLNVRLGAGRSDLIIENVSSQDSGQYSCKGIDDHLDTLLFVLDVTDTGAMVSLVAVLNSTVRMHCPAGETTSTGHWLFRRSGDIQSVNLFDIATFQTRYSLARNKTSGQSILTIRSVQLGDAGLYSCQRSSDHTNLNLLIVLASEPNCQTSGSSVRDEFDEFSIVCSVDYCGDWRPTFSCRPESHNHSQTIVENYSQQQVTFTQTINATRATHGTKYQCSMTFDITNRTFQAPNYSYSWTSSTFLINYPPTRAVLNATDNAVYRHGHILACSADCYPPPAITWFNLNNGKVLHEGAHYSVDVCKLVTDSENGPHDKKLVTVQCVAMHRRGTVTATVGFYVEIDDKSFCHDWVIGLTVGITTGFIAISAAAAIALIAMRTRNRCCHSQTPSDTAPEHTSAMELDLGKETVQQYEEIENVSSLPPELPVYVDLIHEEPDFEVVTRHT